MNRKEKEIMRREAAIRVMLDRITRVSHDKSFTKGKKS